MTEVEEIKTAITEWHKAMMALVQQSIDGFPLLTPGSHEIAVRAVMAEQRLLSFIGVGHFRSLEEPPKTPDKGLLN